jgi:GTP-binding protein
MKILSAEFSKSCAKEEHFPPATLPELVCVGRSNVGKSSLINTLVNRRGLAKVSRTPGKTQLVNFFRVTTADHAAPALFLVDLPGYGYARVSKSIRARWGPLIERYLTTRPTLCGALALVDARVISATDRQTVDWLTGLGLPLLVVATKCDQLRRSEQAGALKAIREALGLASDVPLLLFSSLTREGKDDVWRAVKGLLATLPKTSLRCTPSS